MRIVIPLIAALCSALAVAAQSESQQPVFRSGAGTVAVYVTVSDAEGKLVPDLERGDFEVYDNGKLQNITIFESGIQPITIVVMLDRSGSMISNFRLVRSAAELFVEQLLPGDKARIGSFSNRIQIDPQGLHQQQTRSDRDPPDRAPGRRPDAALECRQRRDHGAASTRTAAASSSCSLTVSIGR